MWSFAGVERMFAGFFYALREEGIPVSLNEWLALMKALSLDLAENSLSGFYDLARSILVKSETYYDPFDAAFVRCFGEESAGQEEKSAQKELPAQERAYNPDFFNPARYQAGRKPLADQEIDPKLFPGTMEVASSPAAEATGRREQEKDSNGETSGGQGAGIGEMGAGAVNFGSETGAMSAVKVAGQRRYRDYRDESIRNLRQYEMALRSLRQLSSKLEGPMDELNLEATVEETGRNNGALTLEWERPRRNGIKVLVLMDSMGSIYTHYEACKKLFNAANKSTHFKEIKFYYFHNCIYGRIYKDQWLDVKASMTTEAFFRVYNGEYRLLIVGDAQMGEQELMKVGGVIDWSAEFNAEPGITWLRRIARHYPYAVWLNPVPAQFWGRAPEYTSITTVGEVFPMYELTPKGIRQAVKRLHTKSR